jgi:ABC-type transport system substrate-binding protein
MAASGRPKIRPNVKWHDGTPFTAQAVADHFNRLLDPANRFAGRAYLAIEKVEAPRRSDRGVQDARTETPHCRGPWRSPPSRR